MPNVGPMSNCQRAPKPNWLWWLPRGSHSFTIQQIWQLFLKGSNYSSGYYLVPNLIAYLLAEDHVKKITRTNNRQYTRARIEYTAGILSAISDWQCLPRYTNASPRHKAQQASAQLLFSSLSTDTGDRWTVSQRRPCKKPPMITWHLVPPG